jgi:hypothetical protein
MFEIETFFEMDRIDAMCALEIYKIFCVQAFEMIKLLDIGRDVLSTVEIPTFTAPSKELCKKLESHIKSTETPKALEKPKTSLDVSSSANDPFAEILGRREQLGEEIDRPQMPAMDSFFVGEIANLPFRRKSRTSSGLPASSAFNPFDQMQIPRQVPIDHQPAQIPLLAMPNPRHLRAQTAQGPSDRHNPFL